MQVVYERCCGLDIHKICEVPCLILSGPDEQAHKPHKQPQPHKEIKSFGTATLIAKQFGHCIPKVKWLAIGLCGT